MLAMLVLFLDLGLYMPARSRSQQAWADVEVIQRAGNTFDAFDRSVNPWWQRILGVDLPADIEEFKIDLHYDVDGNQQAKALAKLRGFPHIKKLTIYSTLCSPVAIAPLRDLPLLKHLELSTGSFHNMPEGFSDSSRRNPLSVESTSLVGKSGFDTALAIPTLEELVVVGIPLDFTDPVATARMKHLRRVHIEFPPFNLGAKEGLELSQVANLSELESLRIDWNFVTDDGLSRLKQLKKLKQLSLENWEIPDKGLTPFTEITNLEELQFWQLPVTDEGLMPLAQLKNLRRLSLNRSLITDEGLSFLSEFANLEELEIGSKEITAVGLKSLTRLTHLRHLALDGRPITDEDLSAIVEISTLEDLTFHHGGYQYDAEGNRIPGYTAEGLKLLANLKNLKRLVFEFWNFSDEEFETLAMIPTLESLGMYETTVTSEAVRQLRVSRPSLTIYGIRSSCCPGAYY